MSDFGADPALVASQSSQSPLSRPSGFDPGKIASVGVFRTYESCERHTFYVRLTNGEGFTMEPQSYATGSVYTNHEGLSIDAARDRALIDAADWADFFGMAAEPYFEDGKRIEPRMTFDRYTHRRLLREGNLAPTETGTAETGNTGSVRSMMRAVQKVCRTALAMRSISQEAGHAE